MASLQATVKAYATAESSPKDVCDKVNRAISKSITLGEELGEARLIAIVRKNPAAPAADLRDAIMRSVTQFCRDDFAETPLC